MSGLTSGVTAVSAGEWHTCAVVNGGAQCWGLNASGQLGNDTNTDSSLHVQVSGLESWVTAVATGWDHSCALANGGVSCWGGNTHGQLGDPTVPSYELRTTPIPVPGLESGVTAISAGRSHTCVVVNGGARCWGLNSTWQIGNGGATMTGTDMATPTQVVGLVSDVTAVSASAFSSCALVNGGAQCWGDCHFPIGDAGSTASVPVQVAGLASGVTAVAAAINHTCVIVAGEIRCWGYNVMGQLGNGTWSDSSAPTPVVF